MFNMRSAGAARLNVTRAAQAGTVTPATAEVQAGPNMARSAVEGVVHPIAHTVDTRTVWPQTLSGVENEGPIGGLLGEDLDKGPPNAEGLIDGPPGAQPKGHMAWDWDDIDRRTRDGGNQEIGHGGAHGAFPLL